MFKKLLLISSLLISSAYAQDAVNALERSMVVNANPDLAKERVYDLPVSSQVRVVYEDDRVKLEPISEIKVVQREDLFKKAKPVAKKQPAPKLAPEILKTTVANASPQNIIPVSADEEKEVIAELPVAVPAVTPALEIERKPAIVSYAMAKEGAVTAVSEIKEEKDAGYSIGAVAVQPDKFKVAVSEDKMIVDPKLRGELLKKELIKSYMSDNKFLTPIEYTHSLEVAQLDMPELSLDGNDPNAEPTAPAVNMSMPVAAAVPSTTQLSTEAGVYRKAIGDDPLQLKIEFEPNSAAITVDNLSFIRVFARMAENNRQRAVEVSLSARVMADDELKKLTARRLAVISNILRDNGVEERRIVPILSNRDVDSVIMRIVATEDMNIIRVNTDEDSIRNYEALAW